MPTTCSTLLCLAARRGLFGSCAAGLLAAGLLSAAGPARAQTDYSMTHSDSGLASLNVTIDGHQWDVYAGPTTASFDPSSSTPKGYQPATQVYCVDLWHWDFNGPMYVQLDTVQSGVMTAPAGVYAADGGAADAYYQRLQQAAWLYNEYQGTVATAAGAVDGVSNIKIDGAALQLAIWSAIDPAGFSVAGNDGSMDANAYSAIYTRYLGWYVSSAGKKASGTLFQVDHGYNYSNYGQNMFGPMATPEPASFALLACGLLPCAALGKRRRAA